MHSVSRNSGIGSKEWLGVQRKDANGPGGPSNPNYGQKEFTWSEILERHKDRRGVYQDVGGVRSIICSASSSHGNSITDERIHYVLPRKPSYRRDIAGMLFAHQNGGEFRVFRKLGVNRYRDEGMHKIESFVEESSRYVFVVTPS